MGKVAKWIATIVVGVVVATLAFLVVLRVSEPTGFKWALAAAGAGAVLGLAWVLGSSWVGHTGKPADEPVSQIVENSEIKSKHGWAVGNARDIQVGGEPPAKRKGRGGSAGR